MSALAKYEGQTEVLYALTEMAVARAESIDVLDREHVEALVFVSSQAAGQYNRAAGFHRHSQP